MADDSKRNDVPIFLGRDELLHILSFVKPQSLEMSAFAKTSKRIRKCIKEMHPASRSNVYRILNPSTLLQKALVNLCKKPADSTPPQWASLEYVAKHCDSVSNFKKWLDVLPPPWQSISPINKALPILFGRNENEMAWTLAEKALFASRKESSFDMAIMIRRIFASHGFIKDFLSLVHNVYKDDLKISEVDLGNLDVLGSLVKHNDKPHIDIAMRHLERYPLAKLPLPKFEQIMKNNPSIELLTWIWNDCCYMKGLQQIDHILLYEPIILCGDTLVYDFFLDNNVFIWRCTGLQECIPKIIQNTRAIAWIHNHAPHLFNDHCYFYAAVERGDLETMLLLYNINEHYDHRKRIKMAYPRNAAIIGKVEWLIEKGFSNIDIFCTLPKLLATFDMETLTKLCAMRVIYLNDVEQSFIHNGRYKETVATFVTKADLPANQSALIQWLKLIQYPFEIAPGFWMSVFLQQDLLFFQKLLDIGLGEIAATYYEQWFSSPYKPICNEIGRLLLKKGYFSTSFSEQVVVRLRSAGFKCKQYK